MPTSVKLAISLAIALPVSATGAAADPVRIVAGSLSFDTGDPPAFSLLTSSGHLFEAEGFRKGWPATCFYQCAPGVAIPISLDNIGCANLHRQPSGSARGFVDGLLNSSVRDVTRTTLRHAERDLCRTAR